MKPEDFKGTEPTIKIEEYFNGQVKAWGLLQNRSGKVTRQFKADMFGKFEYDLLIPFKSRNIKVTFDDWIFKQDEKVAINRATLTKFGFKVGELTVFFLKD